LLARSVGALGGLMPGNGGFDFSHPFHLHGSHFYVLGSGNGTFSAERDFRKLNFENPRLADSQTVGSYGWTYLRFRADNPGVWPLHCHIAVHEFGGMLVLFAHDVESIPMLKLKEGVLPTCPAECTYNAKIYNETATEDATEDAVEGTSSASTGGLWATTASVTLFLVFVLIRDL
jgi:hypothetical protein